MKAQWRWDGLRNNFLGLTVTTSEGVSGCFFEVWGGGRRELEVCGWKVERGPRKVESHRAKVECGPLKVEYEQENVESIV